MLDASKVISSLFSIALLLLMQAFLSIFPLSIFFSLKTGCIHYVTDSYVDHWQIFTIRASYFTSSCSASSTATRHEQTFQSTPKSELGVGFGPSSTNPGSYDFLLASGQIRPHRNIKLVNESSPFGFRQRKVSEVYIHNPITSPTNVLYCILLLPHLSKLVLLLFLLLFLLPRSQPL